MRTVYFITLCLGLAIAACSGKKTAQTTTESTTTITSPAKPLTPTDSIERAVADFDRRLDIKMRRKTYEPKPGVLVTLQQWWEFGDSTRVIKLREEILTGTTRMQILQYHFVNGKLAEIHTNDDNRVCNGEPKQCITEVKYFVRNGAWLSATRREASEGPDKSLPNIEATTFAAFSPAKVEMSEFMSRMRAIDTKWAMLNYPKRRPEQGTPVPAVR